VAGESALPRGGGRGSHRSQISLPSCPECTKKAQKWRFPTLTDLKMLKMPFLLKSSYQNILLRCFLRNILFKKFFVTSGVVELYLFKVLEVIYAPSRPD
jgi:hypothetical protein